MCGVESNWFALPDVFFFINHEWHTIICVWGQYIACYSHCMCNCRDEKVSIQRAICYVNDNVLISCLQEIGNNYITQIDWSKIVFLIFVICNVLD